MNLQDLVNGVYARGYVFQNSVTDPTNPAVIILNGVYRGVVSSQRWPFTEKAVDYPSPTTVGTAEYPLSAIADLVSLDSIRIHDAAGNRHDMENLDPEEFNSRFYERAQPPSVGCPRYWTQHHGQIVLFPTPDQAYTMRVNYTCQPPDLALATDTPVMPAQFHDILVWGAVNELAYRERDTLSQQFAQGMYAQRLDALKENYKLMQRQNSSRVVKSGFNADVTWYGY